MPDPIMPDPGTNAARPPLKECNLVMKGGVTSGVVFPPVVLALKDTYRFVKIGGTSAGAIAAAVTAAAEYGRDIVDGNGQNGFNRLKKTSEQVGQGTFLRDLFQPSPQVRPLMDVALSLTEKLKRHPSNLFRALWGALNSHYEEKLNAGLGLGLALGLVLAVALAFGARGIAEAADATSTITGTSILWLIVLFGLLFMLVGGVLGGLLQGLLGLKDLLVKDVPTNYFGLCTGLPVDSSSQVEVLTSWLSNAINDIAGKDPHKPLTFGDLKDKDIEFKVVTSNLSDQRPYFIPFSLGHGGTPKKDFIFKKSDFDKLFPENVVTHLVNHAQTSSRVELPPGYYYLPAPDDLPVVLGARMSLSFPLLICAVPLYRIKRTAYNKQPEATTKHIEEEDLLQYWFSDGGICSNFPIHLFDDWLPERPTFGVKLTSLPDYAFEKDARGNPCGLKSEYIPSGNDVFADGMVYLPPMNRELLLEWTPFYDKALGDPQGTLSLPKFLWSIFATAQNYRDNTQTALPSYRGRVAHMRMRDEEGGLNLAMPRSVINAIVDRGSEAGGALLGLRFDHHQWVRLLVLMHELEVELKDMAKKIDDNRFPLDMLVGEQFASKTSDDQTTYPYAQTRTYGEEVARRLKMMVATVSDWDETPSGRLPHSEARLRVTPDL